LIHKKEINNIKGVAIFETNKYISNNAYETITQIVKKLFINHNKLNHNTKLIRHIIKHNTTTEPSQQEIYNIENELKELQSHITERHKLDKLINIQTNPNMN